MDELLTRQMPHSLEAEQAVIGSMLIDPSCIADMLELVRPDDFYLQQNKDIFTTIYTMFNYSADIDPVTVMDQMKQAGVYDEEKTRGCPLRHLSCACSWGRRISIWTPAPKSTMNCCCKTAH